ncbi:alpha/beta hydrolase [Salinisphaera japonica YTM-1]|uniref:Alpha/beta hydrolase n=1 Tax=Salinisphaera japonica YTM-1 TaxID=1209778 RepID=A0A423Q084_9GAMM|nr:alpha/beta hydrolase [Salinisphaera japonica YTM-1]
MSPATRSDIATRDLVIACHIAGPADGPAAVLCHGFPYDVHAMVAAGERLATGGWRVVVPYMRGYGPTRFRDTATLRSGQQAALAHDLLALIDALGLDRPVVAGFDWGGRAACIVAALWPERVGGLVSCGGYNIQNIATADTPLAPEQEARLWYQFYFHGARGRAGLRDNRARLARLLWSQWSPTWRFDDAVFHQTAPAFDNPDFVDVVIHSYRHRFGLVAGDSRFEATEAALAEQPVIEAPAIVLDGAASGLFEVTDTAGLAPHFSAPFEHRVLPGVGHNPPQEAPAAFADAVMALGG